MATARCEAVGARAMPGTAGNIEAKLEAEALALGYDKDDLLVVIAEDDEEQEECPKCPPPGAPAWMATFADMATLLMAFFVLILSFSEFNVPKFKQISGSLKNAFGVQKMVPVVEQPKGTTVLSLNFSPSPEASVTKNMKQQTTEADQKNLDMKSEIDEGDSAKSNSKE